MTVPSKGVLLYSNNVINDHLFAVVLRRLQAVAEGMEAVCVSHQPVEFGLNVVVHLPSCAESILRQIQVGLQNMVADVVYLVEHDVLYHTEHFQHIPEQTHHFLYNRNVWQVDSETGQATFRITKRASQLVVYRETMLQYLEQLFTVIDQQGYRPGFGVSPMVHRIEGVSRRGVRSFATCVPNVDIRHNDNLTHYVYTNADILADGVPWWGRTLGRFAEWLACTETR